MNIAAVHGYVLGFGIIGSWFGIMVIALVLRAVKGEAEVGWFWKVVSFAQVLLGIQLLIGAYLFIVGGRPGPDTFTHVFHPLYGFVFPGVVLFYGHKVAREGRMHPLSAFALVGLVNFGLTARAWMVAALG